MKIKVWLLAQDLHNQGTEGSVFGSKDELNDTLREIMRDNAPDDPEEAKKLADLLETGTVDEAWDWWEDNYRHSLDTYFIEETTVDVTVPIVGQLLAQLQEAERFIRGFEDDDVQVGIGAMLKAMRKTIDEAKKLSGEVAGTAD